MKITHSGDRHKVVMANKAVANAGCGVCPTCGETHTAVHYIHKGILNMGILSGMCRTWCEIKWFGFGKDRHMKVDCYHCLTCGCRWESEPYEYT